MSAMYTTHTTWYPLYLFLSSLSFWHEPNKKEANARKRRNRLTKNSLSSQLIASLVLSCCQALRKGPPSNVSGLRVRVRVRARFMCAMRSDVGGDWGKGKGKSQNVLENVLDPRADRRTNPLSSLDAGPYAGSASERTCTPKEKGLHGCCSYVTLCR